MCLCCKSAVKVCCVFVLLVHCERSSLGRIKLMFVQRKCEFGSGKHCVKGCITIDRLFTPVQ